MSWSKSPTGFGQHARDELTKQRNATALEVLTGVIERSPVRSGRFRGNNSVSVGSPDDSYDEDATDPTGQATLAQGQAVIAGATTTFDIIYVQNSLPYSEFLEAGNSKQAPAGVYEVTINSISEFS